MARKRKLADALAAASDNIAPEIPSGMKVDIAVMFPGLRLRHDGWTQARTQRFLDTLAYTGCVQDSARVAGMSAVGARRMQKRYPRFATAWKDALSRAGQGLIAIAYKRAVDGRETVIIRKGEEYERRITPSDAILGLLLKRGDIVGGMGKVDAEDTLTLDEWRAHKRFDERGDKFTIEDPEVTANEFAAKIVQVRTRLKEYAAASGTCPCCRQVLPADWPPHSMAELVALDVVDINEF